MLIGNRTNTGRTIPFKGEFVTVPPMGFVTLEGNSSDFEKLKRNRVFKMLLDSNIFTIGEKPRKDQIAVEPEGPSVPKELNYAPKNRKVSVKKPKKTQETMEV